jgi:hypothetical protein
MSKQPPGTPGIVSGLRLFPAAAALACLVALLACVLPAPAQRLTPISYNLNRPAAASSAGITPASFIDDIPPGFQPETSKSETSNIETSNIGTSNIGTSNTELSNTELSNTEPPRASSPRSEASAQPPSPLPEDPSALLARPVTPDAKLQSEAERNTACETGRLHGKPCRVSWGRLLAQSFLFLSAQHGGNILMDHDTRLELHSGNFWGQYVYCVEHYRWSRWKDDDPFGVDYLGHPMMGAVSSSMYEQNDPKQRALSYENTQRYWMGRLRAMAFSAAYSAQWKVGPASEASIGNTGINYYYSARIGRTTNETGMQDFFVTPIGGLAWNVGEDAIDRFFLRPLRQRTRNKWILFAASLTTPGKSAANVSRFRATYYRDQDLAALDLDHHTTNPDHPTTDPDLHTTDPDHPTTDPDHPAPDPDHPATVPAARSSRGPLAVIPEGDLLLSVTDLAGN